MRYGLTVTTAPVQEPVHVSEAKAHLRVDSADDDVYIAALVIAARNNAEDYTHRAFISTTLELVLDGFPPAPNGGQSPSSEAQGPTIHLPRSPVQSITSITYVDTAGDTQTLAASKYRVDTKSLVPRITPAYGEVWPPTRQITNAVTITFVAGYGDDVGDIPEPIKQAIKLTVATYYDPVRSNVSIGLSVAETPLAARFLLGPYRVGSIAGNGA